ncbi:hypothetical protein [Halorubrum sp. N11]|uniref:hypothetical protein n=1 Tax=Halorubrum sp. N11 TaxID=3402276 RepID=UPI003EBA901B
MSKSSEEDSQERFLPQAITVSPADEQKDPADAIEYKLQQVYGSGTYLSDFYVADTGSVAVTIGNSFPKDVSDCRPNRDRVIKYIAIDEIAELSGEYDEGIYNIQLESRASVQDGFDNAKERLRNELDHAMANAIYKKIATTPAVENQLNPIKQILRWTRLYQPVAFAEVKKAQGKEGDKTLKYVQILQELGFIEHRDGNLYPQRPLEKYDLGDVEGDEFNERILAEVIEQGFHRLSSDLQLGILKHLPKFANGYYVDAVEANNPELHLDLESIQENMIEWYGSSGRYHRFELRDKLSFLVQNDILEQRGKEEDEESDVYYTAKPSVFEKMQQPSLV